MVAKDNVPGQSVAIRFRPERDGGIAEAEHPMSLPDELPFLTVTRHLVPGYLPLSLRDSPQ